MAGLKALPPSTPTKLYLKVQNFLIRFPPALRLPAVSSCRRHPDALGTCPHTQEKSLVLLHQLVRVLFKQSLMSVQSFT